MGADGELILHKQKWQQARQYASEFIVSVLRRRRRNDPRARARSIVRSHAPQARPVCSENSILIDYVTKVTKEVDSVGWTRSPSAVAIRSARLRPTTGDPRVSRVCDLRGTDELFPKPCRGSVPERSLCRAHSQGRATCPFRKFDPAWIRVVR